MEGVKNAMMTDLPLVMANGTFKSTNSMTEIQLERFLSYLVRFTCQKYKKSPCVQPSWWMENVVYNPEFSVGQIPLPYTRNKSVKLRRLVKLCYTAHNCKDLLSLSEKLAALHVMSYKFIRNKFDGTVTVVQVSSNAPIVMIPGSNLDYDLDVVSSHCLRLRELSIIPVRKTLIAYDTKVKPVKAVDDEANNCIIIEDSSSDDDVEIVSYEKGAFPPTPPKRKLPVGIRPGPACSKINRRLDGSRIPAPLPNQPPLQTGESSSSHQPSGQTLQPVRLALSAAHRAEIAKGWNLPDQKPCISQQLHAPIKQPVNRLPGMVPRPALQSQTLPLPQKPVRFLPVRSARPQRHQTFTFVDIDLTIDEDEDDFPEKKAQLPSELTQNTFLAGFNLLGRDCELPKTEKPPVMPTNKKKILYLSDLSLDMVPYMVQKGILPKRSLISRKELEERTAYLEKHTRRDYELSRIVVDAKDSASVAAVTRKCSVRVKKLTSADMRKWRKARKI
uniref:Nuclear respiratory factor 1 NLS/DNA-binding dimerisation domain-containing protein n=1 Tax=Lygus hesperus TaxID=30085 RepID=A0A146L4D1_LYGHE